jgi:hypothetical protein
LRIEAIRPLRVKLREAQLELQPGVPVELEDEYARKLLQACPDAVRALDSVCATAPEAFVCWRSPLFGELKGRLLMSALQGNVLVEHPLTGEFVYIPVTRLIRGEAGESGCRDI